ncbi:hypothetical protein QYF36_023985 [Acer negundo]|nr:hypothetical protein QYF36_023985 [Acer negundo]
MKECIEEGEERDAITEANLRLNVWLRTVSPPKRVHHRSNRDDLRPWNKQAGNSGSLNGKFRSRRFEDKWKVKETVAEEKDSGDQWRNMCQSTTTKKAVESTGPKNRGMEIVKEFNVVDKENRFGEKGIGEVMSFRGEKQFKSSQTQVDSSKKYRPDSLGPPTDRCGLVKFGAKVGTINKYPTNIIADTKKTHNYTNWKREKRQRRNKVRKREEGVVADVDSYNWKKNKSVPQMETESANKEGETVAVEVRPDNSGMECSNL